jgi:hypothetical protein
MQNFQELLIKENLKDEKLVLTRKTKAFFIALIILVILAWGPLGLIFIAFGYFGLKQALRHLNIVKTFAQKNDLVFKFVGDIKSVSGRLFSIGHSRRISMEMSGKYSNRPVRIFNYAYTIGSGKNSHTYKFTVGELEIEKTKFPHIFLKSDSMWHHVNRDFFGQDKDVRIKLEEPYEKKFNLYCRQDYEIEVLQIFTKEFLNYLIEHGNKFSIEFSDNKIYIYDDKILRSESDINELYDVMKHILEKVGPLLDRLHDDFDAMRGSYDRI